MKTPPSPHLSAFCKPQAKVIFDDQITAAASWKSCPVDIRSLHSEARSQFQAMYHNLCRPEINPQILASNPRILYLSGQAGVGKSHLLQYFRQQVHQQGRGCCVNMSLPLVMQNPDDYLLNQVIEGLEKPWQESAQTSALLRVSHALLENYQRIPTSALQIFRQGQFNDHSLGLATQALCQQLCKHPEFQDLEPELLRVLLYLQRHEPRYRRRALKYLRCEPLNKTDLKILGGMPATALKTKPGIRLAQLSQVIFQVSGGPLVLCLDELENISSPVPVSAFMQSLLLLIEQAPRILLVLSCQEKAYLETCPTSLYERLHSHMTNLDLLPGCSEQEARELIVQRLKTYFKRLQLQAKANDPFYPLNIANLALTSTQTPRDILQACQQQQGKHQTGQQAASLSQKPLQYPPEQQALEKQWQDFIARLHPVLSRSLPEQAAGLQALLLHSLSQYLQEQRLTKQCQVQTQDSDILLLRGEQNTPLRLRLCNQRLQNGDLTRQLQNLLDAASLPIANQDDSIPIAVRHSIFSRSASNSVALKLGEIRRAGGMAVILEDSDWRTLWFMRQFYQQKYQQKGFQSWLQQRQPLSQLPGLQRLASFFEDLNHAVVSQPEAAHKTSKPVMPSPAPASTQQDIQRPFQFLKPGSAAIKTKPEKLLVKPHEPRQSKAPATEAQLYLPSTSGEPLSVQLGRSADKMQQRQVDLRAHIGILEENGHSAWQLSASLMEQLLLRDIPVLLVDTQGRFKHYAQPAQWQQPADPVQAQQFQALRDHLQVQYYAPGQHPDNLQDISLPVQVAGLGRLPRNERIDYCRANSAMLVALIREQGQSIATAAQKWLSQALYALTEYYHDEAVTLVQLKVFLRQHQTRQALPEADFINLLQGLKQLPVNIGLMTSEHASSTGSTTLRSQLNQGQAANLILLDLQHCTPAQQNYWVWHSLLSLNNHAEQFPGTALRQVCILDDAIDGLSPYQQIRQSGLLTQLLKRSRMAGVSLVFNSVFSNHRAESWGLLFEQQEAVELGSWFIGSMSLAKNLEKLHTLFVGTGLDPKRILPGLQTHGFYIRKAGETLRFTGKPALVKPALMQSTLTATSINAANR
ncbi:ATP-binding protein [Candidatus Venteria ishoeyi]|uniref:Orc1-like AAA ATPase domain-containing protein n=1 Tax=Candidatus Venteria ishoeyi TaxID=1899563 RepID=A0A1H6F9B7_9GAMM|nr:ATP-binding protein [Candidatus Venteria ishoeyi]SEH06702.1 Uncharacterised protein [Candidatus Venteria ishoeyi]